MTLRTGTDLRRRRGVRPVRLGAAAGGGGGAVAVRSKAQKTVEATDDVVLAVADFDVAPNSADTLVVLLYSWIDPTEGSPPPAPAGWTQRAQAGLSGSQYVTSYTRSASGWTTSTFAALPGEGPPASAQILHAYSVQNGTSYDVASASVPGGAPTTSLAVTSVTTTASADLLLGFWAATATTGSPTVALPGTMNTGGLTTGLTLGGNVHAAKSGTELLAASGATGTRTATISGGTGPVLIGGLLVAVK